MARNDTTSAIIDGLLKFAITGGTLSVAVVAPNALQILDKPLQKYFKTMDERARVREYSRIINGMKQRGLVSYNYGGYKHGIQITKKGHQRAKEITLDSMYIPIQKTWDRKWRIAMFDIPEKHKSGRDALSRSLKGLGCIQLQRSVWLHPFPFKDILIPIAVQHEVYKYVTYIETGYIENDKLIKKRFKL